VTPALERIKIAVTADVAGNFSVCQVVVVDLPPDHVARFRSQGQIDCGRRQRISPLPIAAIPPVVVDKLYADQLLDPDMDDLRYSGPESQQAAQQVAAVLVASGQFDLVGVNREIPCL
jgi:hypothetical protein